MSVKRCQKEVDSREFAEWIAYNNSEHFTIDRTEYMLAILCSLTANLHGKKTTYDDFLLTQNTRKKQSPLVMEKTLEVLYGRN